MNDRVSDQPTTPMPVTKSVCKRRQRRLIALALVGVLLVAGLGISFAIIGSPHAQSGNTAQTAGPATNATQTDPSASATAPATTQTPQATATTASTRKPTPTPAYNLPGITHGRPHLGGPFSDFVGKYGNPTPQGDANSQNFWIAPDLSIDIAVQRNEQGKVTQLNVLGAASWNMQQTRSYCEQFLPDGAAQFNATDTLVEYHSSAGNVMLALQSTACELSFARK